MILNLIGMQTIGRAATNLRNMSINLQNGQTIGKLHSVLINVRDIYIGRKDKKEVIIEPI